MLIILYIRLPSKIEKTKFVYLSDFFLSLEVLFLLSLLDREMGEEVKCVAVIPESVLKKRKRSEEWA